jgi:hypothetical protein
MFSASSVIILFSTQTPYVASPTRNSNSKPDKIRGQQLTASTSDFQTNFKLVLVAARLFNVKSKVSIQPPQPFRRRYRKTTPTQKPRRVHLGVTYSKPPLLHTVRQKVVTCGP